METPHPHPRRRSRRFSLGSLLVLILVIGGWLGSIVRSARSQRQAVAAIQKARGSARYDWENGRPTADWHGKPWVPTGLVQSLGVDYFARVVAVDHGGWTTHAGVYSDAEMVHLGRLNGLVQLTLDRSSVTDAGLVHRT